MTSRLGTASFLFTIIAAATLVGACEGPAGPAGTANVISGRVTLAEEDWSADVVQFIYQPEDHTTIFSAPARYADVAVPELTSGVIENGAVLLYFTPDVSDLALFAALPYRFKWISQDPAASYYRVYDAQVREGSLRFLFFYEALDSQATLPHPVDQTQVTRIFRWVIIPPPAASTVASLPLADGPNAVLDALGRKGFPAVASRY